MTADVLVDGDLERFMFVIRFIRLTADDEVPESFLLLDDCEELPPVPAESLFLLKNVSTLPNGLDHTDPYRTDPFRRGGNSGGVADF